MIEPELGKLLEKVDCRYTLIIETAQRARQLVDGATPLTEETDPNPVTQAVNEIDQDKITYVKRV
ncbi:MAG: DNA-directed RNA polymerase subunit omega [Clostridiales bacterium]|nr:DNA-directed RNA polymerase subunit omega [Clostridiales bacterium]MBP3940040.1 DNA-directed RNA polymerase subunit omega [Christensenellaceae bacterium]MBR2222689.1 DNA-directed RNA polymerase subunit omega [Christensenellaceae bacterium]MBR3843089.1 DNA-directed RNA polymerase subunit omega [Christensenellaceae bacterium]